MTLTTSAVYGFSTVLVVFPWAAIQARRRATAGILLYFILTVTLAHGIVFPALLQLENYLEPKKVDEVLFHLDKTLGLSVVAFSQDAPHWLSLASVVIYKSLFWVLTVWACLHLEKAWGRFRTFFMALVIGYVGAGILYLVAPGCGPTSALPHFHGSIAPAPISCGDPNAMPSMHFATALLLVLFAGPNRWMRGLSLVYLIGTCLGTVLAGEHYFIDWVPAIPFIVFALRAAEKQYRPAAVYFALTIAWLLLVRLGGSALAGSPGLLWTLVLVTLAVGVDAVRREWGFWQRRDRGGDEVLLVFDIDAGRGVIPAATVSFEHDASELD